MGLKISLRAIVMMAVIAIVGCEGGAETVTNPNAGGSGTVTGVAGIPQTDLVQTFKIEMWPNLSERCGGCHMQSGQPPTFSRADDINLAYNEAITVTNMGTPSESRLVSKVAAGHNCWLPNNFECADVMTRWIENWVGDAGGGGRVIALSEPDDPLKFPGDSREFPATATATGTNGSSFSNTVYPLLTAHCAECHVENPTPPQLPIAPYFSSSDINAAYEGAQPKMDLDNPALSRLVLRLILDGHNCWDPNNNQATACEDSRDLMQAAIQDFADGIPANPPVIGNNSTISGAVDLSGCSDGSSGCNTADGGNRYENNLIALYDFKAGSGTSITEVSGAGTPINLTLSGTTGVDFSWVSGHGIEFLTNAAKAQDMGNNSGRLQSAITSSGEYSIEAWAIPANVTQEDANIISYSGGANQRNFTLGQTMYNYDFLHRSTTTDSNGEPVASTPDDDELLQSSLQHVVATFDPVNGRRIYVNGMVTNTVDPVAAGGLGDWDGNIYPLIMGNEIDGTRPWKGILKLVGIHDRALTHQQIVQNFEVGVGEKYFLLFGISHLDAAIPAGSYIMFEFSQIDPYSYLFYKPTYINLQDPSVVPNFSLQGIRIGVNGALPLNGQAFSNVDVTLGSNYTPESGEIISTIGTAISLERGVAQDEFFLAFDQIGGAINPYVEPTVTPPVLTDPDPVADMGVRTFDEINASISSMTGVSASNPAVTAVYQSYKQQLPSVENINGFLSSNQMAIAQMALTYCNELVDNNGSITRDSYFNNFDFSQDEPSAFNSPAKLDRILTPLLAAAMNIDGVGNLTSQPVETEIRDMLGSTTGQNLDGYGAYTSLIQQMITQCGGATCGTAARTEEIVKATCAAAVGGAVMLIQ